MPAVSEAPRARDPRLDVFRGLGMFIILIAHIPWNSWTDWIPARFGFSDAADMFVFCSGMASAIAFGRVFAERGWLMGAVRIVHRVWEVYWAHLCSFFVVVALLLGADAWAGGDHYLREELNLDAFFNAPKSHLLGLMTLTYVPNYFDILPMYLAILCMVPAVMALARVHKGLVAVFCAALWLAANLGHVDLIADRATGRQWFFNPLGWQIVFFTGFAFARGWVAPPPRDRRLIAAALAFVLLAAPVSCQYGFLCFAGWGYFPALGEAHVWLQPAIDKMQMGPLRYAHFMATAYLAFCAAGEGGRNLTGPLTEIARRTGQQTLAVFLTGLVAAQALGIFLDVAGRTFLMTAFANLAGIAILIGAAMAVDWFKSAPWKGGRANRRAAPESRAGEASAASLPVENMAALP